MKKSLITSLITLLAMTHTAMGAEINSKAILNTQKTWNDNQIIYPLGQPQIQTGIIHFTKNAISHWFFNEVPTLLYVLEGELTIQDEYGNEIILPAHTSTISEYTQQRYLSGALPTKVLLIYMGAEGYENERILERKYPVENLQTP